MKKSSPKSWNSGKLLHTGRGTALAVGVLRRISSIFMKRVGWNPLVVLLGLILFTVPEKKKKHVIFRGIARFSLYKMLTEAGFYFTPRGEV
jgi:hypothetical protein